MVLPAANTLGVMECSSGKSCNRMCTDFEVFSRPVPDSTDTVQFPERIPAHEHSECVEFSNWNAPTLVSAAQITEHLEDEEKPFPNNETVAAFAARAHWGLMDVRESEVVTEMAADELLK